jgi:integrase
MAEAALPVRQKTRSPFVWEPAMPVKFNHRFTQVFVEDPEEGTHTDGSGLYLDVRNRGKARSWRFRNRGKLRTIGSVSRVSLREAQALVRQFQDQIERGEDPFAAPPTKPEKPAETFLDAAHAFHAHKSKSEWGAGAQALGRTMIRAYVDSAPCANWPLQDIGVQELAQIFKPTWNEKPVLAKRAVLMLKEMFDIAIADERYQGANPALITKHARLRRILGKQPNGGHRLGLPPESVPKLMAHLRTPLFAHGPDEVTTAEAAEAIGCDAEAILRAIKLGRLPSARRLPGRDHTNASWVIPIAELEAIFRFRQAPRQHAEIPLHAYVLQFIVLTAVRSDMACGLRWDEIKETRRVIDFGDRHKMAARDKDALYVIPLTAAVKQLLDTMRVAQRRDGVDSPLVFGHGPTRVGLNARLGQPVNPNTVNSYYKRQLVRLDLVNGETDPRKTPSVHGFRNTFPEWACDLNDYSRDHVDAQLGHKQRGDNSMYFRNVKYLNHRRGIMEDWEQYALSYQGAPPGNVVPVLPQPMEGKSRWKLRLRAPKSTP